MSVQTTVLLSSRQQLLVSDKAGRPVSRADFLATPCRLMVPGPLPPRVDDLLPLRPMVWQQRGLSFRAAYARKSAVATLSTVSPAKSLE